METIIITTNSFFIFVLILPMRNGNNKDKEINEFKEETFLSYLWGMETILRRSLYRKRIHSSYPTYEEWKHHQTHLYTENL